MEGIPNGLTLFLAVWGAVLSTFAIGRESWRTRRRAVVKIEFDFLPNKEPPQICLVARISNVGREPIYLERAVVSSSPARGPSMESYTPGEAFPAELRPGQKHFSYFSIPGIEKQVAEAGTPRFSIVFYDQVGRTYSSGLTELPRIKQDLGKRGFTVTMPTDKSIRGRAGARAHRILRAVRRITQRS